MGKKIKDVLKGDVIYSVYSGKDGLGFIRTGTVMDTQGDKLIIDNGFGPKTIDIAGCDDDTLATAYYTYTTTKERAIEVSRSIFRDRIGKLTKKIEDARELKIEYELTLGETHDKSFSDVIPGDNVYLVKYDMITTYTVYDVRPYLNDNIVLLCGEKTEGDIAFMVPKDGYRHNPLFGSECTLFPDETTAKIEMLDYAESFILDELDSVERTLQRMDNSILKMKGMYPDRKPLGIYD